MLGGWKERSRLLRAISESLNSHQECTMPELMAYTGASHSNVQWHLSLLRKTGFVETKKISLRGGGRKHPKLKYYIVKPIPSDITTTRLKEMLDTSTVVSSQPEEKPTIIPGHSIIVLRLLAKDKNGAFGIEEPYDKLFLTEILDGCPDHIKVVQRLEVRAATTDDVFNRMDFLGGNSVTR